MFGIRFNKWACLLIALLAANIAYYFYNNWGLITVKVTDVSLDKVIRSIEWQGWVKIYTNLPLDTKVTMYADHVPLAEAMETLAANVDIPASTDDGLGTNPDRPHHADRQPTLAGATPGTIGLGASASGTDGAGAPGANPGGRGGGFGGRRAQWNLAFFIAPTSAQVREEIRAFQSSDPGSEAKVYTYNTPMQLIATDSTVITADPRLQSWPGVKPPDPSAMAPSTDLPSSSAQGGNAQPDPPASPPTALQTYLQAFTQSANIWIMAPDSWAPSISNAPPANPSIIKAVENFVSGLHGTITQAIVLRAGRGGPSGNVAVTDTSWEDRMRNAINGLPPDERPDALDQLKQEVQFRKDLQALPPEQRRQKMLAHFAEKMLYGERLSRLSPEKRARVYHRMIAMREAAKAQK
jgi:hypothetical protein